MPTVIAGFRKWKNKHVCEASSHNSDREWINSVMHVTAVRCNEKLKQCFYKLTCIKMTAIVHRIQADNTYAKQNAKSDRNTTKNM